MDVPEDEILRNKRNKGGNQTFIENIGTGRVHFLDM